MTNPARHLPLFMRLWVAALVVMVLARSFLFEVYRVAGSSMVEALLDGDRILVGATSWLTHPLENGDTIVFQHEGEVLVKRVAACPGDRIAMKAGEVVRNGSALREQIPPNRNKAVTFPEYVMGGNEYFMLGDHRRVSIDSRDFGPVTREQVIGRVVLRFEGGDLSGASAVASSP